jgi:hypothetical protein
MRKCLNPLQSTRGLKVVLNDQITYFDREEKLRCATCVGFYYRGSNHLRCWLRALAYQPLVCS